MANPVCEVLLTELPLAALPRTGLQEMGAIVDFWGIVRLTEDGAALAGIAYEAHAPMAEHQLRLVAEAAALDFSVLQVSIQHRTGFVAVGEPSLLVRVGSRHRGEAFRAGDWIVSELKKRVPIWKHPQFRAHEAEWRERVNTSAATSP